MGLAARGRLLQTGYNTCLLAMSRDKVRALVLAGDLAANSLDKMTHAARANGVPVRIFATMAELSKITGKENAGIFGITDPNLARAIIEEIDTHSI